MKRKITYIVYAVLIGLSVLIIKAEYQRQQARAVEVQIQEQQRRDYLNGVEKSLEQSEETNTDLNKQLEEQNQQNQEKDKQIEDLNKQLQAKKAEEARLASLKVQSSRTYSGGCDSYRSLFVQYGWDVNVAMAIMQAESGCNPMASSPTNDHGLMQINKGLAIYGESIYDPAFNIKVAYEQKYLKGGWRHWTVYNTGAYQKYLRG